MCDQSASLVPNFGKSNIVIRCGLGRVNPVEVRSGKVPLARGLAFRECAAVGPVEGFCEVGKYGSFVRLNADFGHHAWDQA